MIVNHQDNSVIYYHDVYDRFSKKAYHVENPFEQEYLTFITKHEKHIPTLDETLHLLKRDMDKTALEKHPIDFLRLLSELSTTDGCLLYKMPSIDSGEEIRLVYPKNFTEKEARELLLKHYNGEDAVLKKSDTLEMTKEEMLESNNEFHLKYLLLNDDSFHIRLNALEKLHDEKIMTNIAFNDEDPDIRLEAIKKIAYNPPLLIDLIYHEKDANNKEYVTKILLGDERLYDYLLKNNIDINTDTLIDNIQSKFMEELSKIHQKNEIIGNLSEKIENEGGNNIEKIIHDNRLLIDQITCQDNYTLETMNDEDVLKAMIRYHGNQDTRIRAMKNINIHDREFLKEIAMKKEDVYLRKLAIINPHMNDKQTLMEIALHDENDDIRMLALDNPNLDDAKTLLYIKDNDKNNEIRKKVSVNPYLKEYMIDELEYSK